MLTELLRYQDLDIKKRTIVSELNATEESKRARKARSYLKEAEEGLKNMDVRVRELQGILEKHGKEYEECMELLGDYEQVMDTCENCDEISYLSKKNAQLSRKIETIEKEMAALVEEIEGMLKTYEGYKQNVPKYKKEYKENAVRFESMKEARSKELEDLEKEMAQLEKKIRPKLLEAYKKLAREGRAPCLVKLTDGNKCGGCNLSIPLSSVNRLDDGIILCENCRRMIYKE